MQTYQLTNLQARTFLLLKHGLFGEYKFDKKQGVLDFVNQVGCIQFDPIDVCGKNAELVLQSRVKGFTKQMLYDLLYQDRMLIDYFDKNLAIMQTTDWKYFNRTREAYRNDSRSKEQIDRVSNTIKAIIQEKGAVCSKDLDLDEVVSWYWSDTKLSRAALETMYFRGDLVVHHKKGTNKYYDLTENCIPKEQLKEPDPNQTEHDYLKWQVLRRIGAVGFLWNKASDAFLNIYLKSKERNQIFNELLQEEKVVVVQVEGIKETLYCLATDCELLEGVLQDQKWKSRCELIAPLDNFLWDRKLIKALFDFDYKWEIYTPEVQRKYGYYVLPILYGTRFIGRLEAVCDRKNRVLTVKNIWLEDGVKLTVTIQKQLQKCIARFMEFNECDTVSWNIDTEKLTKKKG